MKKLIRYITVEGTIEVVTGLHIGGSNTSMKIGGVDNPVIRNPKTEQPYIPGSSLKGKLRSLLELKYGYGENGGPLSPKDLENAHKKCTTIVQAFGFAADNSQACLEYGPSRFIFRDALPKNPEEDILTETKMETAIDRSTGTAKNRSLRETERVVPGAIFPFQVIIQVFKDDSEEELCNLLLEALARLHFSGLGGSVSRGYGRVRISLENEEFKKKFEDFKKELLRGGL